MWAKNNFKVGEKMRQVITLLIFCFVVLASSVGLSDGPDSNGIKKNKLYYITVKVDGKDLAWTYVPAPGTPKASLGNNSDKASVELLPLKLGEKGQLWQIYIQPIKPGPSYKFFTKLAPNESNLQSPAQVWNREGRFAPDDDEKFYEKYNRIRVGTNTDGTENFWFLTKLEKDKFYIRSLYGHKENITDKPGVYGWGQERVVEAFKVAPDKYVLRHKPPSKSESQSWILKDSGLKQGN